MINEQLMARLGLDTTGFKASLRTANSDFQSFARQLGVGLSVAGITSLSRQVIEYGSTIQDLHERYKVGTTILQQYGNAGELVGTSLEGVAQGLKKLEVAQSQALRGDKAMIEHFRQLNITVEDLRTLSLDELMLKIGNSSMTAADMMAVFGRNGTELRELLRGLADDTIKLGEAMDEDLIRRLDEADDKLKTFWQNVRIHTGSAVANATENIQESVTGWKSMFADVAAFIKANPLLLVPDPAVHKKAAQEILDIWAGRGPGRKVWEDANAKPGARAGAGVESGAAGEAEAQFRKSEAQIRAEERSAQKERERHQLSLADLQKEGAQGISRGPGGEINYATGTMQMQYAAQQARLVEELEAKAKQARLTGFRVDSQTPEELMSRADAIRQTLPIKESEKEVGAFRSALDSSERLKSIDEKISALDLDNQ